MTGMLKKQLNELKEALDATLSKNKEERDAKFSGVGWEYVPKIQASIASRKRYGTSSMRTSNVESRRRKIVLPKDRKRRVLETD